MTKIKYINELKRHDWSFHWSDDMRVWRKGRETLDQLTRFQREHDQDAAIWNQHAPSEYHIKTRQEVQA